jgi:hypothetical protein
MVYWFNLDLRVPVSIVDYLKYFGGTPGILNSLVYLILKKSTDDLSGTEEKVERTDSDEKYPDDLKRALIL